MATTKTNSSGGNGGGSKPRQPAPTKVIVRPPPGNVRGNTGNTEKKS